MDNHSSAHLHAHRPDDAQHNHSFKQRSQQALKWALGLTLCFAVIEMIGGFLCNSLALISDAGHMVTDAAALGLALLAQMIAKRPPSAKHSFGFGRAEALAAFVNSLAMLGLVGWIIWEAIQRFVKPEAVEGSTVFIVASIGLLINLLVFRVLSHDQKSLNTKAAMVHVIGDLLGSIAAIVAGIVIYFTDWMQIDPLLSIVVSLLILKSTIDILRHSYHFLMQGVPEHINYLQVGDDMMKIEGVLSVHDLHVWEMSPGHSALIGHIEINQLQEWPHILRSLKTMLLQHYEIDHVTLQAEIDMSSQTKNASN